MATPRTTHIMPSISTSGLSLYSSAFVMFFVMVVATFPPRRNAPKNSITAAIRIALRRERAPEPTDVAKAFATSFAPFE